MLHPELWRLCGVTGIADYEEKQICKRTPAAKIFSYLVAVRLLVDNGSSMKKNNHKHGKRS